MSLPVPKASEPKTQSRPRRQKFTFEEAKQLNRQSALLARRASLKLDVGSFASETYLPEIYLRSTMEADSEEAISAAVRSLGAARDKSVMELKRAVYKNYAEFLAVSKEVLDFESVLEQMRSIQAKLKVSANALVGSAGVSSFVSFDATGDGNKSEEELNDHHRIQTSTPITSKRLETPNAPSAADIEMRRIKMTSLAETIADFEKHTIPGRYLIFEGGGITEQVGHGAPKPVTLFLFNDAIAMASKRSRLVLSSSKRLVLERLWPLSQISINDTPDTKSITNAFKVSKDNENIILQAETATGKRLWLQQLVKTRQKLLQAAITNKEDGQADYESISHGSSAFQSPKMATSTKSPTPRPQSPFTKRRATTSSTTYQTLGKLRQSNNAGITSTPGLMTLTDDGNKDKLYSLFCLLDQLNASIGVSEYENAAELVDKIKFELDQIDPTYASTIHSLSSKLQKLIDRLAAYLYHEISDLIISKEDMAKYIQLLVLLGLSDEARERFLAARSDYIRERTKSLRFVGDIAKTVNEIGFQTFSSIASTAEWYTNSFRDNPMTAGFVFWAKLEINNYVNIIVKQVFNIDVDFRLIGDCIGVARRQCASLGKIGLDFVFYLDDQLLPHVSEALRKHQEQVEQKLASSFEKDDFLEDKMELALQESGIKGITTSCVEFKKLMTELLADVEPLMQGEICSLIINRVASMIERYSTQLVQYSYDPSLPAVVTINIIGNVTFLSHELLSSLMKQFEERFNRVFGDLSKLSVRLDATASSLCQIFAETKAKTMTPTDLSLYAKEGEFIGDSLSGWLVTMLPLYAKISRDTLPAQRSTMMAALLTTVLVGLDRLLMGFEFSKCGIQQFLLDIHFLLFSSRSFLTAGLAQQAIDVCQKALAQTSNASNIKAEEWYDKKAQSLSSQYSLDFGSN